MGPHLSGASDLFPRDLGDIQRADLPHERKVKFHRRNVLQKFSARSLADLAIAADRLGLLAAQRS